MRRAIVSPSGVLVLVGVLFLGACGGDEKDAVEHERGHDHCARRRADRDPREAEDRRGGGFGADRDRHDS